MSIRTAGKTLLWALMIAYSAPDTGASDDLRFLEGLRQRRLFQLAESHCRQQLTRPDLPEEARVDLTLELIRCHGEQAVHAPPEERDPLWERARRAAADFLKGTVHPRGLLVRVQDALTVLAQGELHRQESEVLSDPAAAIEAARRALREATRLCQQLDDELTREIPLRHRQRAADGQLTADELISLQLHVQFQLARAYRNQALCFPPESDDRIAALTGAVQQLKRPLLQVAEDDPLIWPLRLDLAVSFRLLGQRDEAAELLQQVEQSEAPAELRRRARAEQARLQLDARRPAEALALLQTGRQTAGQASAELDFAHLEVCLALWQAAVQDGDPAQGDSWRRRAVETVQGIEQTHGPYWGRRGDLLLVRSVGRSQAAGDIDILARAADDLYRQGEWSEALSAYQQAGAAAQSKGDAPTAFQLRYKAALVHHTRRQYQPAAKALRQLALDLPEQQRAADVHLLGAWNVAQAARSQPELLDHYAEHLREHLQEWPASPTGDTARIWLGRVCESQQQWAAAAKAFQSVSPAHEQFDQSLRDAARCWTSALQQLQAAGRPAAEQAAQAAAAFLQQTPVATDTNQPNWTSTARFCAGQAARWLIDYVPDGHARAEAALSAALDGSPPNAAWTADAEALLIVALAGQPARRGAAQQRLLNAGSQSPARLLAILQGLAPIMASADAPVRQQLAGLQLAVAERLWEQREQVAGDQLPMLQRARAEALLLAGRGEQARAAYAELARQQPDDGDLQQTYAQLLLDAGDRQSWQLALDAWRRIAARSPPQTDRWYQARYAIAVVLIKLDQPAEAASRIRYLQALPPGLEGTAWKARFQDLLRRCEP